MYVFLYRTHVNLKTYAIKKILILTAFFLTLGLTSFSLLAVAQTEVKRKPNYVNTDEEIFVRFVPEFTIDSLINIRQDLEERNITVNYRTLEFDRFGRLTRIKCEVVQKEDSSGSLECLVVPNEHMGFHLNFTDKGTYHTRFGQLKD